MEQNLQGTSERADSWREGEWTMDYDLSLHVHCHAQQYERGTGTSERAVSWWAYGGPRT